MIPPHKLFDPKSYREAIETSEVLWKAKYPSESFVLPFPLPMQENAFEKNEAKEKVAEEKKEAYDLDMATKGNATSASKHSGQLPPPTTTADYRLPPPTTTADFGQLPPPPSYDEVVGQQQEVSESHLADEEEAKNDELKSRVSSTNSSTDDLREAGKRSIAIDQWHRKGNHWNAKGGTSVRF